MASRDPAPAAEKTAGFDWKTWVAPIVAAAVISFGGAWLGDHFAFSQVKAQFQTISDRVEAMPPAGQIVPRIESEAIQRATDQRVLDLKEQLDRVEQKQDRIIEMMLEEARANQRVSRMTTSR
jgi:hypothetical protein